MYYESIRDTEGTVTLTEYKNSNADIHYHETVEIILVKKGTLKVSIGKNKYYASEGQIVYVPSFYPHSVQNKAESLSYTLMIPYDYYMSAGMKDKIYFALENKSVNREIFNMCEMLLTELKNYDKTVIGGYIMVILGKIRLNYAEEIGNSEANVLIADIIEYIKNNSSERLTLEGTAKNFGFDKYYFSRMFNKFFGCNLKTYIGRIRSEEVEARIRSGENKTSAVYNSGFGSVSSYYRLQRTEISARNLK